jgi:hypothetical protein
MLRSVFGCLSLLALSELVLAGATVESCSDSSDLLERQVATLPEQPHKGSPFAIDVKGILRSSVEDGQLEVEVRQCVGEVPVCPLC